MLVSSSDRARGLAVYAVSCACATVPMVSSSTEVTMKGRPYLARELAGLLAKHGAVSIPIVIGGDAELSPQLFQPALAREVLVWRFAVPTSSSSRSLSR
jgi:hypothetical protein